MSRLYRGGECPHGVYRDTRCFNCEPEGPEIVPVVGGWFACGVGWCVQGETIEEALGAYHAAVRKHEEIAARRVTGGSPA